MATIINGTTGIDKIQDEVVITGTGGVTVPSGTTAERPSSPSTGMLRFNTDKNILEQYNGTVWREGYSPAPEITSVSPTDFDGESGTTITINGNYFSSGAVVQFKKTGGSYANGTNISFVNSNQITADTPEDYDLTESPVSVKIVQDSGSDESVDAITMGAAPAWSTASGNLVTVNEGSAVSTSVTATDDGSIASYTVTSGALPSGVTLNTSTGAITGTAPAVASNTQYDFTITATDNVGNTTARDFNIIVNNINYTAEAIIVAGGGGGGSGDGGGGGAGGFRYTSTLVTVGSGYSVVVGGGGTGGVGEGPTVTSTNGANSSALSITSTGGGRGGQENNRNGGSGGSGGGGGGVNASGAGGSGTSGQGFAGSANSTPNKCGGGGGASQAGALSGGGNGNNTYSAWATATSSGASGYYAGGGGGSSRDGGDTGGGLGGGGNAPNSYGGNGTSGTVNTGGGGGGSGDQNTTAGGGGSGIVIIRTPDTASGSGGTVYVSGGYRYHKFTSSGTFTA